VLKERLICGGRPVRQIQRSAFQKIGLTIPAANPKDANA
jgi:hypothetical protein